METDIQATSTGNNTDAKYNKMDETNMDGGGETSMEGIKYG